jgi:arylsulfatase A-like enzyme
LNLVVVVLDSLRYDSWTAAAPATLSKLGPLERRWSYASWTAPSHHNLLMGLLPHSSPTGVLASDHYKEDFLKYQERLGIPGVDFPAMLPGLWLPNFLRDKLGYRTHAYVSMPVLNPATVINRGFDDFQLMTKHNDMAAMVDLLKFDAAKPSFYLLNVGETHYPYALPHEDPSTWPRVSGLHGVLKRMTPEADSEPSAADLNFAEMHERQIETVRYVDTVFARLFDVVPDNTWIIVTSDHGELFGEEGYFGHGPIMHPKVFEVPYVEGRVPR